MLLIWGLAVAIGASSLLRIGGGTFSLGYYAVPILLALCVWVFGPRQAIALTAMIIAFLFIGARLDGRGLIEHPLWAMHFSRAWVLACILVTFLFATIVIMTEHHRTVSECLSTLELLDEDIRRRRQAEAERERAEAEIRRLNEDLERRVQERTTELEAANRELEAFSYSVSHDLRAPLRSIDGFTLALLEDHQGQLDEEGRHHLARIQDGTRRMAQIIEDLLRLARLDRAELNPEPVDLSGHCRNVLDELGHSAPERRVAVLVQPNMTVLADPNLIREVMENLLGNAWKFTARCAEPMIEVGTSVSSAGEQVYFVHDNGAGFDMGLADKLFKAFQRLHAVTEFEGTGIGLAIVWRIINRHGGRIWAEAAPGRGATFLFTLPGFLHGGNAGSG